MRIVFKILLFPITLLLSFVVAVSRFICDCSGALLSVVSLILFTLALLSLILLHNPNGAMTAGVAAFLISPYGIPKLLEWVIDKLDDFNYTMKSI